MTISLGSWSKELLDRLTMYLIPNQGHHGEFEPGKDQFLTGCFFIRVFLINYGKILKFSIVELEKRNGTQNDREKNRF